MNQSAATKAPMRDRSVDVDAEIEVQVDSRLTGLGRTGIVVMALGIVGVLVGAALFIAAYPDTWKGRGVPFEESVSAVRSVVLTVSAGITLLLLGASMFFHGRQVLGSGSIDHLSVLSELERPAVPAATPAPAVPAVAPPAAAPVTFHSEGPIAHFSDAALEKEEDA